MFDELLADYSLLDAAWLRLWLDDAYSKSQHLIETGYVSLLDVAARTISDLLISYIGTDYEMTLLAKLHQQIAVKHLAEVHPYWDAVIAKEDIKYLGTSLSERDRINIELDNQILSLLAAVEYMTTTQLLLDGGFSVDTRHAHRRLVSLEKRLFVDRDSTVRPQHWFITELGREFLLRS